MADKNRNGIWKIITWKTGFLGVMLGGILGIYKLVYDIIPEATQIDSRMVVFVIGVILWIFIFVTIYITERINKLEEETEKLKKNTKEKDKPRRRIAGVD